MTLHYIYDPLCGWCYAAEALLDAAAVQVPVRLHAGGLFGNATRLPDATRAHIREADARIGALSGQVFGPAYLHGLLADPETVYDSVPPITAILAAQAVHAGIGMEMLRTIQHAHYRQGRRVVEKAVLADLAEELALPRDAFLAAFEQVDTASHLAQTRALMAQHGVQGFPAFILQNGGRWLPLPHARYYGHPQAFAAAVAEWTAA